MGILRKIKSLIYNYKWNKWRNEEYVSDENPIIIGGCGRSGSTLFRLMIDSHPDICIGPESSLFPSNLENDWLGRPTGIPNWSTLSTKFDIEIQQIQRLRKELQSQSEFIEKFFMIYTQKMAKKIWGDKSPRNIRVISYIFKHFPRARFIHMIRDGRDVVCSLRTHPKYKKINDELVELATRNPIDLCIKRWVDDVNMGLAWRGDPRYFEVRYEDLVHDPETTLRHVCSFLGVTFDAQMLEHHKVKGGSRDHSKFIQNQDAMSQINFNSLQRWQKELTEDEKDLFKKEGGDLLIKLGYVKDNSW